MLKVTTMLGIQSVYEFEMYFALQPFLTGSSCLDVDVEKVRALCARVYCIFA